MKKTLIVIMTIGLFPGVCALAQENGNSKGNGGQYPSNGKQKNQKGRMKPLQPQAQHGPATRKGGSNAGSNRAAGHPANNPHQGGAPQNHAFNGNQKNYGNQKNTGGNNFHAKSVPVPAKFQKMGIRSVPQPIQNHNQLLIANRQHSFMLPPQAGPNGSALHASVMAPRAMTGVVVQNHMTSISTNSTFRAQINVYNTNEMRPNNYYWHSWNGINYCHYYDPWGYHWYGWYMGSNYFWTRYYGSNWWWYDSAFNRWCYWHDGGWWWQDPSNINVVYVYNNGNYAPLNYNSPNYASPNDGSPNGESPNNNNYAPSGGNGNNQSQMVYQSNDGTRKIKVMGEGQDAFLYDTSSAPSFDPIYLDSGIKDVKFSDTSNGKPLQIILTLNDGTFQMFDANGSRYNGSNNH